MSRQSASVETRKHYGTSAEGMPSTALSTSSPVAGGNPEDLAYVIREEGTIAGDGVEEEQLEDEADTAAIDDPFDPTTIRISTKQPTVDLVVDRMRHEEIDLQPDFQRGDNVWPIRTRSRLIESLLLKIPLPVFYMAADRNDNWKVVDGLQRLSTLRDFVLNKKLRLRGLEYLIQFDGNSFDDLPRPMQRRITETQLSCHVIEPGTPPEVMYNVFKRINTEGRPLVAQEIRHALNPGPARELLRELAHSDEFLRATAHSVSSRRMADQECVLRFLAFRTLGEAQYGGKFDNFLTSAMRVLNDAPEKHVSLKGDFTRAMSLASDIFGHEAFRKPKRPGFTRWKSPVNKPLFESLSVALAEVPSEYSGLLRKRKEKLVEALAHLMEEDEEFFDSISVGTQTTRQVKIRFVRMREMVQEVLL
ncbi:MAG: DUF262 domain-containing protein [Caldilineaceae bacterium SB0665_bin_21]|nr:DUF262 domain-containing protein [Caldilineaceae bacterium SB0665_bin_21]